MWRLWYGAVLGFMALMAIVAILFTLFLIEASNLSSAPVIALVDHRHLRVTCSSSSSGC